MTYDASDLTPVEPAIDFVRLRPDMFGVPGNGPSIEHLVARLRDTIADAAPGSRVVMAIERPWAFVVVDPDWLASFSDATQPFVELLPFPEGGVSSLRAEILVGAFASTVFMITSESPTPEVVTGTDHLDTDGVRRAQALLSPGARVLGFTI